MKTIKRMAWRYGRKPTKVGYNRKGYRFSKAIKSYKKTGKFKNVSRGEGHAAGYEWGKAKGIDPQSRIQRYSKNSPSFDEGVYKYKQEAKTKSKMADMVKNTKTLSFSKKAANPPTKATAKT